MSWLDKLLGTDYPTSDEWNATTTPDNVLEKLKELNSLPDVIKQSAKKPSSEWFLNSFEHAAYIAPPEQMAEMGHYMAYDTVFNNVASAFAGGTTGSIIAKMFERCADQDTQKLLEAFESRGHMTNIARKDNISIEIYVDRVAASMNLQDTVRLLKHTESFRIARSNPGAASRILTSYPQYAATLD